MVRANPRLPQRFRSQMPKVPDWKLKQMVGKTPRLSGTERRELSSEQLKSSYVPEHLKKHIDTLRHGGAAAAHADQDVRFFLQNVGAERDLGRESLERYYRGFVKVAHEAGVRLGPGLNPRTSHVPDDTKRSAKVITQKGLTEKQQEMVEEQRDKLAKQQLRQGLRGPNRLAFLRGGGTPGLGSSVVSNEQPSGLSSISGYKPGGPENPANQQPPNPAAGTPNPAAGTANPANPPRGFGAPPPVAGFHGLGHRPGHELPDQPGGLTHAPLDHPAPALPTEDNGPVASAAPAPPDHPETPLSEDHSKEPPDMEIG